MPSQERHLRGAVTPKENEKRKKERKKREKKERKKEGNYELRRITTYKVLFSPIFNSLVGLKSKTKILAPQEKVGVTPLGRLQGKKFKIVWRRIMTPLCDIYICHAKFKLCLKSAAIKTRETGTRLSLQHIYMARIYNGRDVLLRHDVTSGRHVTM